MKWQTLAEQDGERTEALEVPQRGCLVRVVVKQGDRWMPTAMTWCPGVQASELSQAPSAQPTPQPQTPPAPPPTPAAPEPVVPAVPESASAPAEAAPADAPPPAAPPPAATPPVAAPELTELLTSYMSLQLAVCAGFRSKIGQPSGPLGFLADTPKVGSFPVKGHGDWVWRIEMSTVSLTNRRRVIELQLPSHFADNAFDPKAVVSYLETTNTKEFVHKGTRYPVDETTLAACTELLVKEGVLRLFAAQPRPIYAFVKK